jgi:hypothetical protein
LPADQNFISGAAAALRPFFAMRQAEKNLRRFVAQLVLPKFLG